MEEHKGIDSKFRLVILAAKRAKQLLKGAKKKIDMVAENPLTISLEEIRNNKVDFEILLTEEQIVAQAEQELVEADTGEEDFMAALIDDSGEEDEEVDEDEEDAEDERPASDEEPSS